jgi:hypothetical protein
MTRSGDGADRDALLLPFLANGTLDDEERARARQHLARSAEARDETAFLDHLRRSLKDLERAELPTADERQRILARIEREGRAAAGARASRWVSWALAASLCMVALEGVWLGRLLRAPLAPSASTAAAEVPAYRTAGGPATAVELVVQFDDSASARQIQELLLKQGLTIVDGPSARGVYALVRSDRGPSAPAPEALLERLRDEQIVAYAGLR